MRRQRTEHPSLNPFVVGGLMFAFIGLFLDFRHNLPGAAALSNQEACQGTVNSQVTLSRQQLAQLLAIPERSRKDRVQQIVGQPYCQLPELQVRAGVVSQRQVYPLAFDPQTRIILLYEGEEYAGYRFSFQ